MRWSLKPLFAPAALAVVLGLTVLHAEGMAGVSAFRNLEALAIVVFGALASVSLAYSPGELAAAIGAALADPCDRREEDARLQAHVLDCAADAAAGMGLIGTVLGMILMLSSIDDISAVPRRLALAMDALFFGLVLSEGFFAPLSRRAGRAASPEPQSPGSSLSKARIRTGISGLMILLMGTFVILYALSAALPQASSL